MSEWLCMSMKPGDTVRPFASMVRVAVPVMSPTAAIFPPVIAIDPLRGAPPLPSTICALVIRRSNDRALARGGVVEHALSAIASAPTYAPRRPVPPWPVRDH